jgi:hypothetical protein
VLDLRATAAGHLRGDPRSGGREYLHELSNAACVASRSRCVATYTPQALSGLGRTATLTAHNRMRVQWAHDVGRSCWRA